MRNGRWIHGVRRGILLLPADLAIRWIDGENYLLIALPREVVDAAGGHHGGGVTDPDFRFPLQVELLGPGFGFLQDDAVAMRAAPFGPIRRGQEREGR